MLLMQEEEEEVLSRHGLTWRFSMRKNSSIRSSEQDINIKWSLITDCMDNGKTLLTLAHYVQKWLVISKFYF